MKCEVKGRSLELENTLIVCDLSQVVCVLEPVSSLVEGSLAPCSQGLGRIEWGAQGALHVYSEEWKLL